MNVTADQYYEYFKNQQKGFGGGAYVEGIGNVYRSRRGIRGFGLYRQRGAGIGSFFAGLFRKVVPFLTEKVIPTVGPAVKESLKTAAANVMQDVIQGENVLESVKKNVSTEGQKLFAKVPEVLAASELTKRKGSKRHKNSTHSGSEEVRRKLPHLARTHRSSSRRRIGRGGSGKRRG